MRVLKQNTKVLTRVAMLVSSVALVSAAWAVDIYKWEDEKGQVFVSDVVPNKYKKTATRIEVRSNDNAAPAASPTPAPAAKEKAKTPESMSVPASATTPAESKKAAATPAAPAPAATATPPAVSPSKVTTSTTTEATDCETLQRLYRESQECFAPFRNATGGIKPEAYDKCKERPEPTEKCQIPQGQ